MTGREKFRKYQRRNPHPHVPFFERPHLSRRRFLNVLGTGITASYLTPRMSATDIIPWAEVETKNTARNVIFFLMAGAPSHVDSFDYKVVNGVQPASFQPETVNGITWPAGLLPKIGARLGDIAIMRSVRAWALQHSGMQTWVQIGRNPAAALGAVAPNIGSIVAAEMEPERQANQVFPTFLALNPRRTVGPGYLPSTFGPFKVRPRSSGLANTTHPGGAGSQARFERRFELLDTLDSGLRVASPLGRPAEDFDSFYKAAKNLMYNPTVDDAFSYSDEESARYGESSFGDACLVASKVLAANQGTRFIQIVQRGWDHHSDIYNPDLANKMPVLGRNLDDGFSALVDDLKANGSFDETLIVLMGEFGRTVGGLSPQNGR
ncbi:MAG: DUF1501 domain-containing protein, partial [bacterium]|nr:DUF1501 domain-containing protein [bacterium]